MGANLLIASVLLAIVLVSSAFADDAVSMQHELEDSSAVPQQRGEPKQTNQGGRGGGGYCRNRWCCVGWVYNGCRRYCCSHADAENEVEPAANYGGSHDGGGGGYGDRGRCRYGCCGGYVGRGGC